MRPVVTPHEMRDIEKQAEAGGLSQEAMMENAGKQAAGFVLEFIERYQLVKHALVLVGKGNNGGDGYVVARLLLRHGFTVQVWQLLESEEFSLAKHQRRRYETCGGKVIDRREQEKDLPKEGIVIDAIFGTGFTGSPPALVEEVIRAVNSSSLPCIALDIPSGLEAATGQVASLAIVAKATVAIEFPKIGYFVGKGFDHVGEIKTVSIGLEPFSTTISPQFALLEETDVKGLIPKIQRTRNKYTAGHVVGLAGSHGMAGSALLASFACLKSGSGIVHLLIPEEYANEFSLPPLEVVRVGYKKDEKDKLLLWLKKASSCFIGPGLGKECSFILPLLKEIREKKMVIDADALALLPLLESCSFPNAILTPHLGEVQRLLGNTQPEPLSVPLLQKCQATTEKYQAHMVLKGAPTFLFSPGKPALIVMQGDPGMATAGSGDVLTGILASLLAQNKEAVEAMHLGVYLHGLAGMLAAEEETSFCMTASTLIAKLPQAFKSFYQKAAQHE
jgi:hydroxyethylthiazole kinase-like uncharacterized protein yjeF